jgi:hypothetical protein
MICGFCGLTKTNMEKKISPNFNYSNKKEENIVYSKCKNELKEKLISINDIFKEVSFLKKVVNNQIISIENIENFILHKKKNLLNEINDYLNNKQLEFEINKAMVSDFEENFEKLKNIKIDEKYRKIFEKKIEDYFNKEELKEWVFYCEKKIDQIWKKIQVVKKDFTKEIDSFSESFLNSNKDKEMTDIKNNIDLHDMSYTVLMTKNLKNSESSQKLETLKSFYKQTHKTNYEFLKKRFKLIKKNFNHLQKKFERNKLLLDDIFSEFKKDFRFINIFQNFEYVFKKCLEEVDRRSKFNFVYKMLLEFLNKITIKENHNRLFFLNEFSSKIPEQIFPYLKSLGKLINVNKFFFDFNEVVSLDEKYSNLISLKLLDIENLLKEI